MVREIRGTVLSIEPLGATVDVAGWGVFVHLASSELLTVGMVVSLKTQLCIKQDGVDLYGFPTDADRHFFELLNSVPGIGPKTAMSISRKASRESLESSIGSRDIDYLTRVIGLGKKAAEKIMVELSEKVGVGATHDDADAEVFDTLVALGYTEREARKTLGNVSTDVTGKDARLKAALSQSSH